MNDQKNNENNQRSEFLISNSEFSRLPSDIQNWILRSQSASIAFMEFFEAKGTFDTRRKTGLPYYDPQLLPIIYIDNATYAAMIGPDLEKYRSMQRSVFSTLAHEIGHHRENTATRLFPENGTEEQYVRYRADLEAKATFSSFPIFKELTESDPSFKPDWHHVGYLQGLEIAPLYNRWVAGESNESIVREMAAKIPNAPYKLSNPPPDLDNDGALTHRDGYIRDYREQRERIKDFKQYQMERGLTPESQSLQSHPQRDAQAFPTGHRDYALFEAIRRQLPNEYSDDMAAHVMLQAKQGGITRPNQIGGMGVENGRMVVMGKSGVDWAIVDLDARAPAMQDTLNQSQAFDQQQVQQHEQWLAQEAQLSQGRGMSRSL